MSSKEASVSDSDNGNAIDSDLTTELLSEANSVWQREPALRSLLRLTVLACSDDPDQQSFAEAVAHTVCYRLLLKSCHKPTVATSASDASNSSSSSRTGAAPPVFCPHTLHQILMDAFDSEITEHGHRMLDAVQEDCRAVVRRDPAMDTLLQVVLFSKGFAALVCHRAAYRLWQQQQTYTAMFLQSQCSAVFGLDLHPASVVGKGVMLDHGTGIVIGETAVVGDGCTLLHGVTLGGTGKDHGDRHPKVGDSVLIGAGSSILGNVRIGSNSKIGAGSVVLRDIPDFATAVGAPAKIIGRVAPSERPGSDMDETLQNVRRLHKSKDAVQVGVNVTTAVNKTTAASSSDELTADETGSEEEEYSTSDSLTSAENNTNMTDNLCPWRHIALLGRSAPPGTLTICRLKQLLAPYHCTMAEIGSCFFALDTRMVGHVHTDSEKFRQRAAAVLPRYVPRLDAAAVDQLLQQMQETPEGAGAARPDP